MTAEEKEEINARKREEERNMSAEKRQQISARKRASRQNMSPEEKEEANARRRSADKTAEKKQSRNARTKNKSSEERQEANARRSATRATKWGTPCAQSIAMTCPNPCDSPKGTTMPSVPGSIIVEPTGSPAASPSSSMPTFTTGTYDQMDAFLNGIMEDDAIPEDEEFYMSCGEASNKEDITIDCNDVDDPSAIDYGLPDKEDFVYANIPSETHVLSPIVNCLHCEAKRLQHETPGFCCRQGKIRLKHQEPIPELRRLWSSKDPDSIHFRKNTRFFNGHFSLTTLGVKLDHNTANMKQGVYTFRAHGQIYHKIHSFGKEYKDHLQLYFYDDDPTLEHRFQRGHNDDDKDVIRKLVDVLKENPYSRTFRSLGSEPDIDDWKISLNLDKRLDQRVYNKPVSSEVATVWVKGNDLVNRWRRSITLYGNNNDKHSIQPYYGCYDPLSYPLFFPRGELGWHRGLPMHGVSYDEVQLEDGVVQSIEDEANEQGLGQRLCVSVRDYYCYRLQTRPGIFNPILHGGRLFQQFAVDMYMKVEGNRLEWVRRNQDQIRADLYHGIVDSISSGEFSGNAVGKRIVLPGTFQGCFRDMKRRHMDAMALVQKYGKPDVFLTMTCNPNWDEIKEELLEGQEAQDRPDLVVRVFRAKLEDLKDQLIKKGMLGKVIAYVYVVEFQKRGLPHAHFLLIMDSKYKLKVPEQYDRLISAELPDKHKYPELYGMVVKHMMHGPCGTLKPTNVCMVKGSCKCKYPRPFNKTTIQGKDSYPVYRRRDNGRRAVVRKATLDNRWVVPYNPYLLRRYNCHINVEVCSSIKAVKYLYKYIYKGNDRASFALNEPDKDGNIDEINIFQDARWVTPQEALWRIYSFYPSVNHPPVKQLQLHLPNMHTVTFREKENFKKVIEKEKASKTMLTEYFQANKTLLGVQDVLYKDFPQKCTWNQKNKKWQLRKQGRQLGRVISSHPGDGDRFYLRVILNAVAGATSFDDLKTVNGYSCSTFREAAQMRGLIEGDKTLDACLTEATLSQMPCTLRRLFATILAFCEPEKVRELWNGHMEVMMEDFKRSHSNPHIVVQMVLRDIRGMLQSMGKEIESFDLPDIDKSHDPTNGVAREIIEESSIGAEPGDHDLACTLNTEQLSAYQQILEAIESQKGGVFFVDGPGGTGKTYLYRALCAKVRGKGKIAVATATSGVAASIMPGGRTAHSRFKIPLNLEDGGSCNFTKQSGTAKLLKEANLIIWDEASMTKRQAVEALDSSMRDIMGCDHVPFGGKTVVFGGDFRQVLPVVRKGTRGQITNSTLRSSYLWHNIRQLRLVQNMRAHNDPWFAEYLLRIGNDIEETDEDNNVCLPANMCVPDTGNDSDLDRLIEHVFPMLDANVTDQGYITSRAILSTKNECVDRINMRMIERFQGEEMIYHSFDSAEDDPHGYYPLEFLNTLTPNGLPPHILKLKINCPIMLLRNIDPTNGLCKGTRLVVRGFHKNIIDAEIVLGQHARSRVFLPRIPLCPSDNEMFPFHFKRKQFPVRLSFAMTINKSQGQTIPNVGVYLPDPVFSHGQLYVALSRATAKKNIKILACKDTKETKNKTKKRKRQSEPEVAKTANIVYKEVLTT